MNTIWRYEKKLRDVAAQQTQLMSALRYTDTEFYMLEFEFGCRLVQNYFLGESAYSKPLLTKKIHGYWPWFVNQKRRMDSEFLAAYGIEFNDMDDIYHLERMRSDYFDEMSCWIRRIEIHDRMREFLNKSETLFT